MKRDESQKIIIYQLLPRLFTNTCDHCMPGGTMQQNSVGKFADINEHVLRRIRSLGATHVWLTGVIEHATATDYSEHGIAPCNKHVVKGLAGSPYAIRDYYDIDPDLAVSVPHRMAEFESLVQRVHDAGMRVIIDFVPNHVAREYASDVRPDDAVDLGACDDKGMFFSPNNNFYYITGQPFEPAGVNIGDYREMPARATGNDCFTASPGNNDWWETVKLNYGIDPWNGSRHFDPIPPTWRQMLHILLYWAGKGIDGWRCDMVHMVPVEFWQWAIPQVKQVNPALIFIAEIYDPSLYHAYIDQGGFDYLYDKVTLYDTLIDVTCHHAPARRITQCWQAVEGLQQHLLNFMENHDEQRLASQQLCGDPWRAWPAVVVSATLRGAPFMLYAGQELGEPAADAEGYSGHDGRTTIFDYWSIPTLRRWLTGHSTAGERRLRAAYRKLLRVCNDEPALGTDGGFFDLMYVNEHTMDANSQYAYLRYHSDTRTMVLIVANFADHDADVQVVIPQHALTCAALPAGGYEAVDLLTGDTACAVLGDSLGQPFPVHVQAHQVAMWKLTPARG